MTKKCITVVGAGYTGLTTAAELSLRGFRVNVVAQDLGYRPPLTIVGTQVLEDFAVRKHTRLEGGFGGSKLRSPLLLR